MKEKPHGKNLRKGRFSETGQIYVVTTVTRKRKPLFKDFRAARTLIQTMIDHDKIGFTHTLCFVIMPDHLHWMIQLKNDKTLGATIQALKSMVTRKLGEPVFQKGYYDHALRNEEDIKGLARYIVANPLRAGLVKDINDYPHWNAVWM